MARKRRAAPRDGTSAPELGDVWYWGPAPRLTINLAQGEGPIFSALAAFRAQAKDALRSAVLIRGGETLPVPLDHPQLEAIRTELGLPAPRPPKRRGRPPLVDPAEIQALRRQCPKLSLKRLADLYKSQKHLKSVSRQAVKRALLKQPK